MTWSPKHYIDSTSPWPDSVQVIRDQADESRRYVLEEACVPHGEWKRISQTQEVRRMVCDCGYELGMDEREHMFGTTRYFSMPRFCPECGRKLVSRGKVVGE